MRNNKGFTLIELILYVSLATLLLSSLVFYMQFMYASRQKSDTVFEVEQEGSVVMDTILYTIRKADGIISPATSTGGSTLILAMPQTSENPTTIAATSNTIYLTSGSGAANALTSSKVQITNATFFNVSASSSPGAVRIFFTANHYNPATNTLYNFSQQFRGSATIRP